MFRKILAAFDGSKQADSAFQHALEIAQRFQAELLVVSIARPPEPATRVELEAVLDDAREHFEKLFVNLRAAAQEQGVKLRTEVDIGHPAEQIVRIAERDHADMIVMGRRGKSTIQRWMLGSVSERVLRYAHCPVLVVRQPARTMLLSEEHEAAIEARLALIDRTPGAIELVVHEGEAGHLKSR